MFLVRIITTKFNKLSAKFGWERVGKAALARAVSLDIARAVQQFRDDGQRCLLCHDEPDSLAPTFSGVVANILREADRACAHHFSVLGQDIFAGDPLEWHCDFKTGYRWPANVYYREIVIPYGRGDIKVPWELSRFQHLITLGLAYRFSRNSQYVGEFQRQIASWISANPVKLGPNWACTMDVAIRAVNWLVAWEFFRQAPEINEQFAQKLLKSLLEHARFIHANLEYSVKLTSNHYLADLAGLYFIAAKIPQFKAAEAWRRFARRQLECEIAKQVYPDGTVFEASTCYHRLSLELLFYPALLGQRCGDRFSDDYLRLLHRAFAACRHLLKPNGHMPQIGDNDSGQLLKTYRRAVLDMRYLLALGAVFFREPEWKITEFFGNDQDRAEIFLVYGAEGIAEWQAMPASQLQAIGSKRFTDSGWYVMRQDRDYCLMVCGPNGQKGNGGHAHNDKLSFELVIAGQEVIVDPGTFLYTLDPDSRNRFRSTGYHNTIVVNDLEQNRWQGQLLFTMDNDARAGAIDWQSNVQRDLIVGEHCGYHPIIHRRSLIFLKDQRSWRIEDMLIGEGQINLWLALHFAPQLALAILQNRVAVHGVADTTVWLQFPPGAAIEQESYDYSCEYGSKQPAIAAVWRQTLNLPCCLDWKIEVEASQVLVI